MDDDDDESREVLCDDFTGDTYEELFMTVLGAVEHGDLVSLRAVKEAEPLAFSECLKNQGGRLICEAVRWRHYETADFLLCNGCSIRRQHPVKTTALHLAARDPRATDFLERLLMYHGALTRDDKDNTPLHSACFEGLTKHVEILLQRGAPCDDVNSSVETPLHLAARRGHTDCVKLLVQHGASVNSRDSDGPTNRTPLDSAVESLFALLGPDNLINGVKAFLNWEPPRADDILKLLKSFNIFKEEQNLEVLVSKVYALLQIMDVLIQNGAKFDILFLSAKHARTEVFTEIARELVENCKVDVNTRDLLNYTPLHVVLMRFPRKTLEYFIEHGANVDAMSLTGVTPLDIALEHNAPVQTVELLIENGAAVNYSNDSEISPLTLALIQSDLPVAKLLLSRGANPNAREPNTTGFTPLMRLVSDPSYYHIEAVECLLKHGADVTMQDTGPTGFTPLHMAAMCPSRGDVTGRQLVKMMLKRVKNVDLRDNSNFTPLLRAVTVQYASIPIIRLLLEHGSNPNLCGDGEGDSPLEVAIRNSKNQVVDILMEFETAVDPGILFNNRSTLVTSIAINKPYNQKELFATRKYLHREDIKKERMKCIKEFVHRKKCEGDFFNNLVFCLYELLQGSALERSCVSVRTSGCAVLFCEAEYYVLGTKRIEDVDESVLRGLLEYRLEVSEGDSFKGACVREMENMKDVEVWDELSLKDLLTSDMNKLTRLMRKNNVYLAASQNLDVYSDELRFPVYSETIRRRVAESVARRNLLNAASYFMNESLRGEGPSNDLFAWLPLEVVECILSYIPNADLINWILYASQTDQQFIDELKEVWRIKLRKLLVDDCRTKYIVDSHRRMKIY